MNSKWTYHKELIHHLEMQHALQENILAWIFIIYESVNAGLKNNKNPREQAAIIKEVYEQKRSEYEHFHK